MVFQALSLAILSLYDFLLRSYITGKLRTPFINFSSNSPLQLMVYKNTAAVNKQRLFLPVVTRLLRRHAEVKDRMPRPQAQRHPRTVTAGHSWARPLKTSPYSKPQIWFLRTASRLPKRQCVVLENQSLTTLLRGVRCWDFCVIQCGMYHGSVSSDSVGKGQGQQWRAVPVTCAARPRALDLASWSALYDNTLAWSTFFFPSRASFWDYRSALIFCTCSKVREANCVCIATAGTSKWGNTSEWLERENSYRCSGGNSQKPSNASRPHFMRTSALDMFLF